MEWEEERHLPLQWDGLPSDRWPLSLICWLPLCLHLKIAMEPRCSPGRKGEQVEWGWVENRVSTGSLGGRWATAVSPDLSELPFLLSFIQGWRLVKTQGASQWASRPTAQASATVLPYKRTLALEEKGPENSVLFSRQGCSSGCPRGH